MDKMIHSSESLKKYVQEQRTVPGVYGCQVTDLVIICIVRDDIGQEFKVFISGDRHEEIAVYQIL